MSSAMGSEAIQRLVNVSVLSTVQSFQKDLENELFTSSVSKRIINNEGELFNSLSCVFSNEIDNIIKMT